MPTLLPSSLIWSRDAFVAALALTLLHSLWQGAVMGLLALGQRLKRATPDTRCGSLSALLVTIFVVWIGTFGLLYQSQIAALSVTTVHAATMTATTTVLASGHFGNAHAEAAAQTPVISSFYPFLVALWAIGVCALSLRQLGGFLLLRRLCGTLSVPCSPAWEACAARISARMRLRRRFTLRCSTHIDVPCAFGVLHTFVLLPLRTLTGLSQEQVEALIAHELAHLARHDILFNALQLFVETVLFYHPTVWWLSAQIRLAREQRCDDLAIEIIGDRAVYARALYALEETRGHIPQLALGAKGENSAMLNTQLVGRIRRILGNGVRRESHGLWATGAKGALAFGGATVGLLTFLPVQAFSRQQPKPISAPDATAVIAPAEPHTKPPVYDISVRIVRFHVDEQGNRTETVVMTPRILTRSGEMASCAMSGAQAGSFAFVVTPNQVTDSDKQGKTVTLIAEVRQLSEGGKITLSGKNTRNVALGVPVRITGMTNSSDKDLRQAVQAGDVTGKGEYTGYYVEAKSALLPADPPAARGSATKS